MRIGSKKEIIQKRHNRHIGQEIEKIYYQSEELRE